MGKKVNDAANSKLSPRELEILKLLCDGLTAKEIGNRLDIAAKTVEYHRHNLGRKSHVTNIVLLVRWAIRHKFIKP